MPDLTSAQRLAAYRDELVEAGFDDAQVANLVGIAAPRTDDIEVQADLDDATPPVGEVTVRLTPSIDPDALTRVVGQISRRARMLAAAEEAHDSTRFASGGVVTSATHAQTAPPATAR